VPSGRDRLGRSRLVVPRRPGRQDSDGRLVPVDPDAIAAAKAPTLEHGVPDFTIVPAADFGGQPIPGGSSAPLFFEPAEPDDAHYVVLCQIVADPTVALIGRSTSAATAWSGPGRTRAASSSPRSYGRPTPTICRHPGAVVRRRARARPQVVVAFTKDYQPGDYDSDRVARIRVVIAEATGEDPAEIIPIRADQPDAGGSLLAALTASLAIAQANKERTA
jgi:hypothetical protein